MGLLTAGKPLSWPESLQYLEYIKKHGILQFLNVWNKYKDRCCDEFKWGDEIEYLIVYAPTDDANSKDDSKTDNDNETPINKQCKISLRSAEIQSLVGKKLEKLSQYSKMKDEHNIIVHPEYGSFMIEATPYQPYGDNGSDLLNVEINMLYRRDIIESCLNKNERLCSLSSFPTLGIGKYSHPYSKPYGAIAQSQFISDSIINPHPRFGTLTANIRMRRGKNVDIRVPIYKDINTNINDLKNEIYMDAMAFGMGCCCLQVTFQAIDINEARHLYDQLAVLTPIMMALTASTPFLKGKISNLDCRWTVIAQSVDDRTDQELGLTPINNNNNNNKDCHCKVRRIYKSRYDTIDSFLSSCDWLRPEYHDIKLVYDECAYKELRDSGVDNLLAKHIAHLFIRDPLAAYSDYINVNDNESTYHFETIQSTNWQNVRFKPPPLDSNIGWRVEFRSMELQITEFENAAFSIFVTLISRAILFYGLNFYVPISKIDENFHLAHENDANRKGRFWWRTCTAKHGNLEYSKMSVKEILCGNFQCRGLISIVKDYIHAIGCNKREISVLTEYLLFIERRANGEILTTAQWLRQFVYNHKLYKKDSNLNEEICRDIVDISDKIVHGDIMVPELLGKGVDIKKRRKLRLDKKYNDSKNDNDNDGINKKDNINNHNNNNDGCNGDKGGSYNERKSGKLISKL